MKKLIPKHNGLLASKYQQAFELPDVTPISPGFV